MLDVGCWMNIPDIKLPRLLCRHSIVRFPASRFQDQRPHSHLQNVGVYDAHVRLCGESLAQVGDQAVVQLNGDHAAGLLGDQLGEHAGSGADFKDRVGRRQIGRSDDAGAVCGINEEVLAQALLRVDAEGGELRKKRGWRRARNRRRTSNRLPGRHRLHTHLCQDRGRAGHQNRTGRLEQIARTRCAVTLDRADIHSEQV